MRRPIKTLFMDEISVGSPTHWVSSGYWYPFTHFRELTPILALQTGLDSSTTFNIVRCIRNFVQFREATVLVALLQPAPETYDLFDDIILMAEVRDYNTILLLQQLRQASPRSSYCHGYA